MNDKEYMNIRECTINESDFCKDSEVYPSRQREIIQWFNSLPVNNRWMVKTLIDDAIQQHENNKEKKDAQAHTA